LKKKGAEQKSKPESLLGLTKASVNIKRDSMKTEDLITRTSKQTDEPVKPWADIRGTITTRGLLQTIEESANKITYKSPSKEEWARLAKSVLEEKQAPVWVPEKDMPERFQGSIQSVTMDNTSYRFDTLDIGAEETKVNYDPDGHMKSMSTMRTYTKEEWDKLMAANPTTFTESKAETPYVPGSYVSRRRKERHGKKQIKD
jgi:hypothetical protein